MMNQNKIKQSNVNRAYNGEELNDDVQQKQSDGKLDQIQQMELMESAVADAISRISNDQQRFTVPREIPFVIFCSIFVLFFFILGFFVNQKKQKHLKHVV